MSMITMNCIACNAEFEVNSYYVKKHNRRFCSLECSASRQYNNNWKGGIRDDKKSYQKQYMAKNKHRWDKILTCKECGIDFKRQTPKISAKFCSVKCMASNNQKIKLDKEELENMYMKMQMSTYEIGRKLAVSDQTVAEKLKQFGIQRRHSGWHLEFSQKEYDHFNKYGIVLKKSWKNTIRQTQGKNESLKHWGAKAALSLVLMINDKEIVTEAITRNGVIDVYNLTDKVAYEIELACSPKKIQQKVNQLFVPETMTDIFVFSGKEIPDTFEEMCVFFAKRLGLNYSYRDEVIKV